MSREHHSGEAHDIQWGIAAGIEAGFAEVLPALAKALAGTEQAEELEAARGTIGRLRWELTQSEKRRNGSLEDAARILKGWDKNLATRTAELKAGLAGELASVKKELRAAKYARHFWFEMANKNGKKLATANGLLGDVEKWFNDALNCGTWPDFNKLKTIFAKRREVE